MYVFEPFCIYIIKISTLQGVRSSSYTHYIFGDLHNRSSTLRDGQEHELARCWTKYIACLSATHRVPPLISTCSQQYSALVLAARLQQ